jgi:2-polyprenyl-6-methoxyphenol hydroxylase-like FAD-dependent oxidoreductase
MSTRRALIIGGSLGGLLAAHLLRDAGWDVVVFERNAEDLTGRGAGISTHPQLIDILRRVGIAFDESMGIKVDTVICLDHSGHTYLREPTRRTMSSWGRLYRSLRDPLPPESYRLGMSLRHIEQDADGVTAVFADGTRVTGDLLVGADGLRSTVREQLLPDLAPNYAGYVAWRAMLDESEVPPDIHAEIFERYTFCLPEGEQCLAYPVPGRNNETQPGRRAYNIVWYRPADPDQALVDLCTDASGRCHGTSIPPPLIRPEVTAAIKATARAGGAAGRGDFRARSAAVLPGDLRFHLAADRIRPRGAAGGCRVPGAAASHPTRVIRCRASVPGNASSATRPSPPRQLPASRHAPRPSSGHVRFREPGPFS